MLSTQSSLHQDQLRPIQTEDEYEQAIARIELLWDAEDGTPDAQIRDMLVLSVEEYETRNEDLV
jgi:HTH-type transcriptional regulator/antitoxin HigA